VPPAGWKVWRGVDRGNDFTAISQNSFNRLRFGFTTFGNAFMDPTGLRVADRKDESS